MVYTMNTVDEYIQALPSERQSVFQELRDVIKQNLPKGFEECMSYNMPAFSVPHSIYPAGYHCKPEEPLPFLSIASQKNFIGFYHMGIYVMPDILDWFTVSYTKLEIGKLDMGKSCVRFKKIDRMPYELIAELCQKISVDQWIEVYERELKK
jgi:uncharacterized protein YdhG (YjbR/CyaY superfamily)